MFVCKSISLANYLISNDLHIRKVDLDNKSTGYVVFLFEKSKLLNDTLERWNEICKK